MAKKSRIVHFGIELVVVRRLRRIAEAEDLSLSAILRRAIAAYLAQRDQSQEKEAR